MIVFRNKKALAISAASLVLVGGVSAFAYITASGASGSGTATVTKTAPALVLSASGTGIDPFTTGKATVPVKASNASKASLGLPGTVPFTVVVTPGSGSGTCDSGDFTVAFTPIANVTVPASSTGVSVGDLTVTFVDSSTDDQNACLGAGLGFTFGTVSGT